METFRKRIFQTPNDIQITGHNPRAKNAPYTFLEHENESGKSLFCIVTVWDNPKQRDLV